MSNHTSPGVFSSSPGLTRKITELTEYVIVDDEEFEVLVWEIELRVGEEWTLYGRRYVRTADLAQDYNIRYSMVYNEDASSEEDAVRSFNKWIYHILRQKVFKDV